eukprot:8593182-Pyramimonas_sp.AAC.1
MIGGFPCMPLAIELRQIVSRRQVLPHSLCLGYLCTSGGIVIPFRQPLMTWSFVGVSAATPTISMRPNP